MNWLIAVFRFEMESPFSDSPVEVPRPSSKSGVDSVEIVKLQKFVVALYDRIEQLELENDTIRNELSSIHARLASQAPVGSASDMQYSLTKSKIKRTRAKKAESEIQDSSNRSADNEAPAKENQLIALKAAVATVFPDVNGSIDDESSLELFSWSILSGSHPSNAIKLMAESLTTQ